MFNSQYLSQRKSTIINLIRNVFILFVSYPFQSASLAQEDFPPAVNSWMAPTEGEVRSPCLFINTLANSGKGVGLFGMVDELTDKFDVARTLFDKLASGAIDLNFTYTDENSTIRMGVDQLFAHNKQEQIASFVRADKFFGEMENKLVDPLLLSSFLDDMAPDSDTLSKEDILKFQTARLTTIQK